VQVRADEQTIRRVLAARLADTRLVSVQRMPQAGLFEIAIQRSDGSHMILYTDGSAQVILVGSLIEVATDRNLTEERLRELSAVDWNSLPFQSAITSKRGNGRRQIAILSDPNCPFCRKFESDLEAVDDITLHTLPFAGIRPDSVRQSKAVWCSPERAKAWNELMHKRIEPAAEPDCETPIEKLIAFGRSIGANATPTWILPNGAMYSGAMRMVEVVSLLDAAATERGGHRR